MQVLLARLLSVIRRGRFPVASVSASQVKTGGGGGKECGLGLSNGASLLGTSERWWGLIDLSGLMGTQWLTPPHATSFNAKPNGQAWSNPLPTNLFTPRHSWDYCPTCLPTHLPLATKRNALWKSMPYTPFSSLLKSVSQEGVQKQQFKPVSQSWHNLEKDLTLWAETYCSLLSYKDFIKKKRFVCN